MPKKTKSSKSTSSLVSQLKSAARLDTKQSSILFIGVLFALVMAVGSATYYRFKYAEATQPRLGDYYGYKVWAPGDIVESKDIAFSLNGVRTDTTNVPKFWELQEGNQYVIVDVSFKNRTYKPYELSPVMSMKVRDNVSGKEYGVTSAPAIEQGLGGQVASQETMRGEVGFTLPVDAKDLTFIFEPYLSSSAPITVNFTIK